VEPLASPDLPAEEFAHAALQRHSRRAYDGSPIAHEPLADLERFCAEFRPSPSARVLVMRDASSAIYRGIVGSYGRVTGAPSALAMVGDSGCENAQESVGYTGEAAILKATSLGLGSCWVGGLFKPEATANLLDLAQDEKVYAVSPLGYPARAPSAYERSIEALKRRSRRTRKTADEIAPGVHEWPEWMRAAVELARIAPSAVNRQPWRFSRQGSEVLISFEGREMRYGIPKRLDCGIAMLHFELGARCAGMPGSWLPARETAYVARYVPE